MPMINGSLVVIPLSDRRCMCGAKAETIVSRGTIEPVNCCCKCADRYAMSILGAVMFNKKG